MSLLKKLHNIVLYIKVNPQFIKVFLCISREKNYAKKDYLWKFIV